MSRSERRAYQRMTKNQDPMAPPPISAAARARLDRKRAQRGSTARPGDAGRLLSARAAWWVFGGGLGVFLIGLSLAWHPGNEMNALMIGVASGVAWIAVMLGLAAWRRRARAAAPAQRGRPAPR